jgi:hypothetical protein
MCLATEQQTQAVAVVVLSSILAAQVDRVL